MVVCLVIILANIELYYNEHRCRFDAQMPKKCLVIMPKDSGLEFPIYVYNKSKVKKRDLDYQLGYNSNDYIKRQVPEHVASKITGPIREIASGIKRIPTTKMPVNALYSSLGKSDAVISSANPLMYTDANDYRILIHKHDALAEAFIANGRLYIL